MPGSPRRLARTLARAGGAPPVLATLAVGIACLVHPPGPVRSGPAQARGEPDATP